MLLPSCGEGGIYKAGLEVYRCYGFATNLPKMDFHVLRGPALQPYRTITWTEISLSFPLLATQRIEH